MLLMQPKAEVQHAPLPQSAGRELQLVQFPWNIPPAAEQVDADTASAPPTQSCPLQQAPVGLQSPPLQLVPAPRQKPKLFAQLVRDT